MNMPYNITKYFSILLISFILILPPAEAGSSVFGEFTISDEAELGEEAHRMIRSRLDVIEDPEITGYIKDLASRLAESAPPQPFPVTVDVVNHNAVNAFATVAGYMVIFSGLILNMDTESELASIIAHELAHITQRHIARNIERSKLISVGTLVGLLAGAFIGSEAGEAVAAGSIAGGQSAVLKYSREDEQEADQVGLNFLVKAGFNPSGVVSAMEKMRKMQWFSGGEIPSYLSTHPGMDQRTSYLQDRVNRLDQALLKRSDDNYRLRRVQTLLRARYSSPSAAMTHFRDKKSDSCLGYLGKGIVNSRTHKIDQARENFEKLIECDDNDPLFLREAGIFYFQFGDLDTSAGLLQKAVMSSPRDTQAIIYYARNLSEQGLLSDSISYLEKALEILPENPLTHEHLARVHGKNKDNFMAHLHMAYARIFENNKTQARFHLDKAKSLAQGRQDKDKVKDLDNTYQKQAQYWK
ncbi:MAG: M48 family metalloprotease [Desulfonatronovibrio sp.]